jgi:hypothetical protein
MISNKSIAAGLLLWDLLEPSDANRSA